MMGPMGFGVGAAKRFGHPLAGRLLGPGIMLATLGAAKAAFNFLQGGYDMTKASYSYNPPGASATYRNFPMEFSLHSRTAYGNNLNATGSLAFALHNQRRI
jgi:hypothetical protein